MSIDEAIKKAAEIIFEETIKSCDRMGLCSNLSDNCFLRVERGIRAYEAVKLTHQPVDWLQTLDRTTRCLEMVLGGKPVRGADEVLSEARLVIMNALMKAPMREAFIEIAVQDGVAFVTSDPYGIPVRFSYSTSTKRESGALTEGDKADAIKLMHDAYWKSSLSMNWQEAMGTALTVLMENYDIRRRG
jgi:hypothetical protein